MKRTSKSAPLIAAVVVVAVALIAAARLFSPSEAQGAADGLPTFTVERGALTISVTEAGTIRPREQIIIKSQVEGQAAVLSLVKEGVEVRKGDLLIELDASQLVDQHSNQQIQVINADAAYINASENLEVVKSQAQANIDAATLELQFARQDLEQYRKGQYKNLQLAASSKITLAQQTLTNAEEALVWSNKLLAENYISESEQKRDQLSVQKATLDLELARDELRLFEEYTSKRQIAQLESDLKQAEMATERVERKARADIAQAEAQATAKAAELQQQKDKLAKIARQIENTKIYAPAAGTVIYASSTKSSWRGNEEPFAEGQTVRERQELIYLPTTAAYNAEIKVHESSLQKIRPGLPVRITIDALPGQILTGTIATIAPLPDAQSVFMNPDLKVYNTSIEIAGNGEGLRNGMSCLAEIIVARYDDVVFVPVQAIMRVAGKPTAFLVKGGQVTPREVGIGLDNNRMVHVTDGLTAGETVLLTPPLSAGKVEPLVSTEEIPPPSAPGTPPAGPRAGRGETPSAPEPGASPPERPAPPAGGAPGDEESGGRTGRRSSMTPEEREAARERMNNMTPEEREAMRARWQQGGGGGGDGDGRQKRGGDRQ